MKYPALVKSLPLLVTLSLVLQNIWPAVAQTSACVPGKCVYLAFVSRTPFLVLTHEAPNREKVGGYSVKSYILNTTSLPLKDIVLKADFINSQSPPDSFTYTLRVRSDVFPVLAPGEFMRFTVVGGSGSELESPIVNLSAITWTIAADSENQPISITAILTSSYVGTGGLTGTTVTVLVRNPLSTTLRNTEVTVWAIDESGRFNCPFLGCYGRALLPTLGAGEVFTLPITFPTSRAIPADKIQVSAHGIISP